MSLSLAFKETNVDFEIEKIKLKVAMTSQVVRVVVKIGVSLYHFPWEKRVFIP